MRFWNPGENKSNESHLEMDLDRCVFKPPQTKSQLFNSYTQLEGGRIKYVNFKIITNPNRKPPNQIECKICLGPQSVRAPCGGGGK